MAVRGRVSNLHGLRTPFEVSVLQSFLTNRRQRGFVLLEAGNDGHKNSVQQSWRGVLAFLLQTSEPGLVLRSDRGTVDVQELVHNLAEVARVAFQATRGADVATGQFKGRLADLVGLDTGRQLAQALATVLCEVGGHFHEAFEILIDAMRRLSGE